MPVSAPADKRFRRAHVSPRRRRGLDRAPWMKIAAVVAGVALLAGLAAWAATKVAASDTLKVATITVEGTHRMPEGVVQTAMAELIGESVFSVDLEQWRDELRKIRWVADASVRRVLPSTLAVTIVERQPIAIGRVGDTLTVIDRRGVILDQYGPNYKDLDLPIVDGLAYADEAQVGALEQTRASLAVRLLNELQRTPDLSARVSQVDVSDARDAVVLVRGDATLLHLGDREFGERLQAYVDLAPRLKEEKQAPEAVDLRFGKRVYARYGAGRTKGTGGEE